jgi:hypothetical protein
MAQVATSQDIGLTTRQGHSSHDNQNTRSASERWRTFGDAERDELVRNLVGAATGAGAAGGHGKAPRRGGSAGSRAAR